MDVKAFNDYINDYFTRKYSIPEGDLFISANKEVVVFNKSGETGTCIFIDSPENIFNFIEGVLQQDELFTVDGALYNKFLKSDKSDVIDTVTDTP